MSLAIAALALTCWVGVLTGAQPVSAQTTSDVYNWGSYFTGPADTVLSPTPVGNLSSVVAVDASNESGYALEANGTVWAWGEDQFGDLGDGSSASSLSNAVQVKFPAGVTVVSIGEAYDSGFAVDSTGQGWEWGYHHCAGTRTRDDLPEKVAGMTDAKAVQGSGGHVLWLLQNGEVASCGIGPGGQLGLGTEVKKTLAPTVIPGLADVVAITAGTAEAALASSGQVYTWGFSDEGQAGVGTAGDVWVPTSVDLPAPAVEISSGGDVLTNGHMLALLSNGEVYGWGSDADGQLGFSGPNQLSPTLLPFPAGAFDNVVAGGNSSYGLDSDGNVWAWGGGPIGNGTNRGSRTAVVVDQGVTQVSATAESAVDLHSSSGGAGQSAPAALNGNGTPVTNARGRAVGSGRLQKR